MSVLSDKYYSRKELLNIAKGKNIKKKHFDDFICFIEKDLQQLKEDNEVEESERGVSSVEFVTDYFDKFYKELQKGHSEEWAKLYCQNHEEHAHAFYSTYKTIREIYPQLAFKELEIHCKACGGDEYFAKHFFLLMEDLICSAAPAQDEQSEKYFRMLKEQTAMANFKESY